MTTIERRLRQSRRLDSRPCRLRNLPTVEIVFRVGRGYYTRYPCLDSIAAALQMGREIDGRRVTGFPKLTL